MSVLYTAHKVAQPGVKGGGIPLYRAGIVYRGTITYKQLVEQIESSSLVNGADVVAVIYHLRRLLEHYLSYGYIVILDEFGTFLPYIQSRTCQDPHQVNESLIKRVKIGFRPCPQLERAMFNASFTKARKK